MCVWTATEFSDTTGATAANEKLLGQQEWAVTRVGAFNLVNITCHLADCTHPSSALTAASHWSHAAAEQQAAEDETSEEEQLKKQQRSQ